MEPLDRPSHPSANRLFLGDNLAVMRTLDGASLDLVYADPPFFSGRDYDPLPRARANGSGFTDTWREGLEGYLAWLNERFAEMHRLLRESGSLLVHCDWHAGHYIKVELDKLFGYGGEKSRPGFRNEIVWAYDYGGRSKDFWPRKHDVIFWYSKSTRWTFNHDALPREPMTSRALRLSEGRDKSKGKTPTDVWRMPTLNINARERLGYPTQKPEALIERLLLAHSSQGHVVGDFFCGSGTVPAVAQRLGRRWVACDSSEHAIEMAAGRLHGGAPSRDFIIEKAGSG